MASLLELSRRYFDTDNLYKVLEVKKGSTEKEVRKAYYVLSMKYHPDKVADEDKAEATEKFKVISCIHALLSDADKRKLYDDTGCVGDDVDTENSEDFPWDAYWQTIFKKITDDDIREYELKYKGSEDENRDLKKAYLAGKGDMDLIINMVPFSSVHEEDRLREVLAKIIEEEDLPKYEEFINENPSKKKKRLAKAKKEEVQCKYEMEKKKKNEPNDLMLAIQKRSAERADQFDNFVARMEAKYCNPKSAKKVKKSKKN